MRLKPDRARAAGAARAAFQYQKGAIKTNGRGRDDTASKQPFQYQKGAIKTILYAISGALRAPFNTKKVRLKLQRIVVAADLEALLSIPKRCD